jgi:hypothetical protein
MVPSHHSGRLESEGTVDETSHFTPLALLPDEVPSWVDEIGQIDHAVVEDAPFLVRVLLHDVIELYG